MTIGPRSRRPLWLSILRSLPTIALIVLLIWMWPTRFGGQATVLAVDGNSMKPTYNNGDIVVARSQPRYHVGDIVIFGIRTASGHGAKVVHRIIAVSPDGSITTQGDNRRTADSFHTTTADVLGRIQWRLPHGATLLRTLSRWWLLALACGALTIAMLWPVEDEASAVTIVEDDRLSPAVTNPFEVCVSPDEDGTCHVTLCGELDLLAAPELESTLRNLWGAMDNVRLDLSLLSFIDPSARSRSGQNLALCATARAPMRSTPPG